MKGSRIGFDERAIMLLKPQDIVATATQSSFVDMKDALHATFLIPLGVLSGTTSDGLVAITLTCATGAASTNEVALAFTYRLSGAVGTDTLGAPTAAANTGVSITLADDNKLLIIDLDPAKMEGALATARFASILIVPEAGSTVTNIAVICLLEQAYAMVTPLSTS